MVELQGQSPVSLNPTNWKHIDFSPEPDATVGCDLPRTVEVAGSAVKKQFQKGDCVFGAVHGSSAV